MNYARTKQSIFIVINKHLLFIVWNLFNITDMDEDSNLSAKEKHSLSVIKDSNLQLSLPQSSSSQLPKIAIWKDERLEYLNIPKGLIEILQINGFTIEMILDYGPSQIAEKLRIEDYVAKIIFTETTKANNNYKQLYSQS
ncbi:MAG: hypothetical protein AB7P56_01845 [Nitrososphaeraceae archaeon]